MGAIRRDSANGLLQSIEAGYLTVEQLVLFFEPPFDPRNQGEKTWQEIRGEWFEAHLVYRGCKVTRAEWVERTVTERTIKFSREQARASFGEMAVKVRSYILHYRPTMDKVYTPNMERESITVRPEASHQWLTGQARRIAKLARKERVAERLASVPNATKRAIERYQLMLLDQQQRFPGLPNCYLPKEV